MNDESIVVCFGDSNTWGCDPSGGPRFDRATRWPWIMREALGERFHMVEEGLGGRTTVWDDPVEGDKNGSKHLVPLLWSHHPLDLLIIMLGTNDLKHRFDVSAWDVASGLGRLVEIARGCLVGRADRAPEILVVCPPPFADMRVSPYQDMFAGGEEKSHQLAPAVAARCQELGVPMLDAGEAIRSSSVDGIHLGASEHRKLGVAVADKVRTML